MLLHILACIKDEIKPRLVAVHVNHGINQDAESWEKHCRTICENYAIELLTFTVDLSHKNGKGTEAYAREKRYEVFNDLIKNHDLLLTAHHVNDQIETMLLQLLRGSGPDGLVGMPQSREFSKGFLVRPLLDTSREEIHDYALKQSLNWVEDESNKSNKYDRNFLRNTIIPELLSHWPGALKTMRRAIEHQADARNLINEISIIDLSTVCDDEFTKISLAEFESLSFIRRKNVLRAWIKKNNLETPNTNTIEKINEEVIHAGADKNPCVKWTGAEVRRYRGYLYVMQSLSAHDVKMATNWNFKGTLKLSSGYLKAVSSKGIGIKKDMISSDSVEVKYRQGGEHIKPSGRSHTHELKKLLQEEGVLPWLRDRIPLIFYDNDLIA
ncbi:MAG: tRNA lysidine(34) synthetase TilS, partial [Gammaproteobacteria bacterium]|nr:tRNA lysidine(34) synthetase TilS [Gammaproteobacteria bacterium]